MTCHGWEIGKSLDWFTELPPKNLSLNSPIFLIQNIECYFCIKGDCNGYHLFLKSEGFGFPKKSFNFTVYVNYDDVSREQIVVSSNLNKKLYFLKSSIDSKKTENLPNIWFTFVFEQMAELELSFPTETKTENKSVRTESLSEDRSIQTGYLNANVPMENLSDFSKFLEIGCNPDAEIKCVVNSEHSLPVLRAVLCARWEIDTQSVFLKGKTGGVEIKNMDPCYFRDFIQYLCTGSMPELTFNKAKALYDVSDKYRIKSLMLKCSEYLEDNLSEQNAFECFSLGDEHSDQKLKDKIKYFIIDKKMYLEEEYWPSFCEKFPKFAIDIYRLSYEKQKNADD